MTSGRERGDWRGVAALLACLALALRVLVPAGFMVQAQAGPGFPLVLCTGHGAVTTLLPGSAAPDQKPAPSQKHDGGVCVFAGHGAPVMAPDGAIVPAVTLQAYEIRVEAPLSLAPGRGLAAPPPPARGPPGHLLTT